MSNVVEPAQAAAAQEAALPVFGSAPLSSVAYATQEMPVVLGLGGAALSRLAPWVAAAIMPLLMLVIWSYRQICLPYSGGVGAHVARTCPRGPRDTPPRHGHRGRAGAHVGGYWQQKLHNESLSVLLSHLKLVPGVVLVHGPHQLSLGRPGREPPRHATTLGTR